MTAYYYNVKDYGALGNGVANDTTPIQNAINDAISAGGLVVFPPGTYLVKKLSVFMANNDYRGIQLRGANYANSILQRYDENSANAGPMLDIVAHSVQMSDLKFVDYIPPDPEQYATNEWVLVQYSLRNDFDVDRCWFASGWVPMKCYNSDQVRFNGCLFEAGRKHGLWFEGFHNGRIIGNVFFRHGRLSLPDNAALKIEGLTGHEAATDFTITGNYFIHSQRAHHIGLTRARGVSITGNFFNLAGIWSENAYDDINLAASERVTIVSNTSVQVFDPMPDEPPLDQIVNRRIITIDSACRNVQIGENSFQPGHSGTISDAAPDTSITPATIRRTKLNWAPGTIYANTGVYTDVPVPGARPGDAAMAAWEGSSPGAFLLTAHVATNDSVNVTLYNATPYAYLNTGHLHVTVWKKPPVS